MKIRLVLVAIFGAIVTFLAAYLLPNIFEYQQLERNLTEIAQADATINKQRIMGFQKNGWTFDSTVCPYETASFNVHEVFGYRSNFTETINSETLNAVVLINTDSAKAIFVFDRSLVDFCSE